MTEHDADHMAEHDEQAEHDEHRHTDPDHRGRHVPPPDAAPTQIGPVRPRGVKGFLV
ncbi:MAG: hypothetical protein JO152_11735, partial [Mycobacteriaceae bacterium]|nr:hypothetical protein [Mycobacteriaceae bacterium]